MIERVRANLDFDGPAPAWLPALLDISDFAHEVLRRDPELRRTLVERVHDPRPPASRWQEPVQGVDAGPALRRFRRAESVRLIARDLLGLDDVVGTLAGSSRLAETCIGLAVRQALVETRARHGGLRDDDGLERSPIVFALGKLGGGELNFSSDVDLVFAYTGEGAADSAGPRPLAPDAWHARLVRHVAQLLGEITNEGFVYRVDLRLRPFGQSGRTSLPLVAMEQYFQREGRDWERYAWLKARAVAGDGDAGEGFLRTLRPFVYRRYLDYNAIDALREMKAQIDLEVQRQDLTDDVKLGRGGIREIEFLVQVVQLVRGGREPALRRRGLLDGLAACAAAGYIGPGAAAALREAYLFLRRLENRLQMLRDAQTQALPATDDDRRRIAHGLAWPDWSALRTELDRHRERVAEEFAQVLGARSRSTADGEADHLLALWRTLADERAEPGQFEQAGIVVDEPLYERLRNLACSSGVAALSARARGRLDHLMASLLDRLRGDGDEQAAAVTIIDLLQVLLRRSNYLALLEQQPAALARLFDLAHGSRWLVRRLVEQPLLLDDVFDPRAPAPPDEEEIRRTLASAVADGRDQEAVLAGLAEAKASLHFRLGLATIDRTLPAPTIASSLAAIAQAVLAHVLDLALADAVRTHGWPEGAGAGRSGLVLVAYGSLGAGEMGFASDLDLVFLFDGRFGGADTDGRSVVEGQRFYARVVQKLIAYLAVPLPGGRLYEIDPRLRPDGAKGALVTSLDSWTAYQHERAWTWEQQALVRTRFIVGDDDLGRRFQDARRDWLVRPRDREALRATVTEMRERLRRERDRSRADRFDLKQGRGGLVDLEFLLQFLALAHAHQHPSLQASGNTMRLLRSLNECAVLDDDTATALLAAHAIVLQASLACTLDDRPRIVAVTDELFAATDRIAAACCRWLDD